MQESRHANANAFGQYHAANYDFDAERNIVDHRQPSEQAPPFVSENDEVFLRGIENIDANAGPGTQIREPRRNDALIPYGTPTPYSMLRRSISRASESPALAPMQSFQPARYDATPQDFAPVRQTKYEPFQYRFNSSVEARDYRRRETRFGRTPYCDPNIDTTITEIENNRQRNVERIYNAMTSGESAKDNRGSIAMKRWVLDAHYPPDLVEAYAHKVFDCLLAQAKEGFRGWVHNDYVADERKGEDIDKDVDCAGRLDNIVQALEHEKTICEDVMNSACQIRMFVNAPRAYSNRKHQNRVGNSKRGRTKDTPDPNPRPAKAARAGGRRTRARSSTTSDMPPSRGTTPQYHQPLQATAMPYFHTPPSQQGLASSPGISLHSATRFAPPLQRPNLPIARSSFGQFSNSTTSSSALSPRTLHAPQMHTPRMLTAPSDHMMPRLSPQPPSYGDSPIPATPEDAKSPPTDKGLALWREPGFLDQDGSSHHPHNSPAIDPMLGGWNFSDHTPCERPGLDMFDGTTTGPTCSLTDLERQQTSQLAGLPNEDMFQSFWDQQHGVQQFPHQS
ncbi:hypothetical protein FB567DRAFT_493413 [Paraphoma chrysanthemicola]|uniref:Uncharacterized protein n=1 Tax=Paraphoma chrysanthemicola TaxID=798071 RepID=A0A8K0R7X4_9PLEO|nr:hypothetical protein FB567DRAFT_493413 [Paraphoma chrysanthemicola]